VKFLDLFCCQGGASTGYTRAGFTVYGVDIDPQPHYPFPFHQGDALDVMRRLIAGEAIPFTHPSGLVELLWLHDFVAAGASPPCQGYTALKAVHGNEWPLLIEPTRDLLDEMGIPYVIENVQGSPLRRDMTLCGLMFGLRVFRHRYFELGGWAAAAPAHPSHKGHRVSGWRHGVRYEGDMVAVYGEGGGKGSVADWQAAMGIDWTSDRHGIAEAIPPAYTEHIGLQLLEHLAPTRAVDVAVAA
jgi:DNA (cytosine-5)-methyltransferase 1